MIYLQSAGLGQPEPAVHRRIAAHAEREAEIGAAAALAEAAEEMAGLRAKAARLIHAAEAEIAFANNTLAGWRAIVENLEMAGKRLLVAPHEWGDFTRRLAPVAAAMGARIEALAPLDWAAPDLGPWSDQLDDDVAAIFIPAVTSAAGLRYPFEAIGALPRPAGCKLIVDAAQAWGQLPVDVRHMGADAVYGTLRKWVRGPRQTGMVWLNPTWAEDPRPLSPAGIELHDRNAAVWLGLGLALDQIEALGIGAIQSALTERSALLRAKLAGLGFPALTPEAAASAIVTIGVAEARQPAVAAALAATDCAAKWVSAAKDEPFAGDLTAHAHVLRLSPHLHTTEAEIEQLCAALAERL